MAAFSLQGDRPDDEGSTNFWNVELLQRDYTSVYHRKLSSPYLPPWEPETSRMLPSDITMHTQKADDTFICKDVVELGQRV
jgi:hypothetical protein